ncbi:MAG: hypothetical protein HN742_08320 [Lentisphaerae bacterium]|nr:hypothetical protein [Lentisphaerota bacterium]MBT4820454.1 hypothetical protein [Lentisphaerota bacterium]MBT5610388.1 hypothetical protein [Lentisphaerota bacterium]MBT7056216.1 hypothetical protein [Lentisphaerota bacterium]MBT7841862.1 hypothetical protein [Lentisphaerota bacterium]
MSHRRRRTTAPVMFPPRSSIQCLAPPWDRQQTLALLLALAAFGLATALRAAQPPTRQRGRLLKTELLKTDHEHIFRAQIAPSSDCMPRILLTKYDTVTYHEVGIYEVLLEFKAPDETDRGKIVYRVAAGETIRGEATKRSEELPLGPCAGETFTMLSSQITCDAAGVLLDREGLIHRVFDDLATPGTELTIAHQKMGQVTISLTRDIIARRAGKATAQARMKAGDILAAMGLDFRPATRSGHDDLAVTVSCPETVAPGQRIEIAVEVENDGSSHASSVVARTVSRHAWLNGRNFYIGGLAPGDTQSFSRSFAVPTDAPSGTIFLAVGMWDILGAMPDYNTPLRVSVTKAP